MFLHVLTSLIKLRLWLKFVANKRQAEDKRSCSISDAPPRPAECGARNVTTEISPECSLEGLVLKLQYFGPVMQSRVSGKHQDARKDRRQEEKGMIKEEMVHCHYQLIGHECEQTPGGSDRHRSLAYFCSWGSQVQFLGRKDPLQEGMIIYFSILAWRIPRTEKPSVLWSTGLPRVGHD